LAWSLTTTVCSFTVVYPKATSWLDRLVPHIAGGAKEPEGVVSPRKGSLEMIDGIETPDEHTVRFILKQQKQPQTF